MGVLLQYFAAISSSLGALSAGTALGWTSNLEPKIMAGDYGFDIEDHEWAIMSSMLNVGAAVICTIAGFAINFIGRRKTMLLVMLPFIIGWVLLTAASNVAMLIIGRTFLGIACGGICVSGPVYCGEIAEKSIRGTLGSFFQLMITLGILLAYVLGCFCGVRVVSFICLIIPIAFGFAMYSCPESPTFLIMKGNEVGAIKSLKRFRGNDFDTTEEITDLQKEEEIRKLQNIRDALARKSSKKAMSISFGLMFFQQLSGINAVIFYMTTIFSDSKIEIRAEYATIIVGVVQVIATFAATLTLDKIGRRLLLLVSDSLMALCTLVLAIYSGIRASDGDATDGLGWLPLLSLCVFIIAFSLGFGPVPWLMVGEIFSSDIKGLAGSLTGTLNWSLAFIVTMVYPYLSKYIGVSACFAIFTAISIVGTLFSYFIVPETKGKSLKEIQEMLGEK